MESKPMSRDVRGGILFVLLLTMAMDLGTIHARHHADSLVPVMLSLHRWTPFYWEQDRFGMLVPLLARPFSHPLFNLLVQSGLIMLSTMLGFLFLAMRLARRRFALLFSFSVLLLMLCTRDYHAQIFLPDQPYGSAFGLITGAALAARKGRGTWRGRPSRRSIFWVVVANACLRSPSGQRSRACCPRSSCCSIPHSACDSGSLAAAPVFAGSSPGYYLVEVLPVILIALTSLCPTLWLMWTYPYHETSLKSVPIATVPRGIYKLLVACLSRDAVQYLILALCAVLTLPLIIKRRPLIGLGLGRVLATVTFLLTVAFITCFSHVFSLHVWNNEFNPRYIATSVLFLIACAAFLLSESTRLLVSAKKIPRINAMLWALTLLVIFTRYGYPSLGEVRRQVDATLGGRTPAIQKVGARFVVGDYWNVWPMTFHANLVRYELGQPPIWAITKRSRETEHIWRPLLDRRAILVSANGDDPKSSSLKPFSLDVRRTTVHDVLDVYTAEAHSREMITLGPHSSSRPVQR